MLCKEAADCRDRAQIKYGIVRKLEGQSSPIDIPASWGLLLIVFLWMCFGQVIIFRSAKMLFCKFSDPYTHV